MKNTISQRPNTIRIKLKVSKRKARQLLRVKRWEEQSEGVNLILGPRSR